MLKNEPLIMYNTDSVQNTTLTTLFESFGYHPNVILHASQIYVLARRRKQCGLSIYCVNAPCQCHKNACLPVRIFLRREQIPQHHAGCTKTFCHTARQIREAIDRPSYYTNLKIWEEDKQMSPSTITLLFLLFAVVMFVLEKIPLGVTSILPQCRSQLESGLPQFPCWKGRRSSGRQ